MPVNICANCKHSAVYEEDAPHMRGVRYCGHESAPDMALCEVMRRESGFCGPDGTEYEAKS